MSLGAYLGWRRLFAAVWLSSASRRGLSQARNLSSMTGVRGQDLCVVLPVIIVVVAPQPPASYKSLKRLIRSISAARQLVFQVMELPDRW